MILPVEDHSSQADKAKKQEDTQEPERPPLRSAFSSAGRPENTQTGRTGKVNKDKSQKPLFTVKPGGIAGYLCEN